MNNNNIECCICMETKTNSKKDIIYNILPCNHILCLYCLCEMRNFDCPLCRYNFKQKIPARIITIIENNKLNNSNSLTRNNNINNSINNNIDFTSNYQFPPLK